MGYKVYVLKYRFYEKKKLPAVLIDSWESLKNVLGIKPLLYDEFVNYRLKSNHTILSARIT